jgi:hypothetical protein
MGQSPLIKEDHLLNTPFSEKYQEKEVVSFRALEQGI